MQGMRGRPHASAPTRLLLCCIALSSTDFLLVCCAPPPVSQQIPANAVFYNPKKIQLYYFPGHSFDLPECALRDSRGDTRFSVDQTPGGGGYVVSYKRRPSAYDSRGTAARVQEATDVSLDLTTGLLSLESHGTFVRVNLSTYLPSDSLQAEYRTSWGGYNKTVLPNNVYIKITVDWKTSSSVFSGNTAVTQALYALARTATRFTKPVGWPCMGSGLVVPGSSKLAPLVKYLTNLMGLPKTVLPPP